MLHTHIHTWRCSMDLFTLRKIIFDEGNSYTYENIVFSCKIFINFLGWVLILVKAIHLLSFHSRKVECGKCGILTNRNQKLHPNLPLELFLSDESTTTDAYSICNEFLNFLQASLRHWTNNWFWIMLIASEVQIEMSSVVKIKIWKIF